MSHKYTLIADAGSTKTEWVLLENDRQMDDCFTSSINPYVTSLEEMVDSILSVPSKWFGSIGETQVYFYGAGCSSESNMDKVSEAFKNSGFKTKQVFVSHDLVAAGRALLKRERGIACILGTGSSSALFKNGEIVDQIPPLGYVLGDEGAGVDFGKRLLTAVLKKEAPEEITGNFYSEFNLDVHAILERIHFDERPNKFLASFVPFVKSNIGNDFIEELVMDSFDTFIRHNILKYEGYTEIKIGFVGSVAYHFKDHLLAALSKYDISDTKFLQSPMKGLIEFHTKS